MSTVDHVPFILTSLDGNEAQETVTEKLGMITANAASLLPQAQQAISNIKLPFGLPYSDVTITSIGDLVTDTTVEPLVTDSIKLSPVTLAHEIGGFVSSVPADITVDDFTTTAPTFTKTARPSLTNPTAPAEEVVDTVTLPVKPDVSVNDLIARIKGLSNYTFPSLSLPTNTSLSFTETLTLKPITVTPTAFSYSEGAYASPITQELVDSFLRTWRNGGTALGGIVEAGIWKRGKDRILDTYAEEHQRVSAQWAAAGWEIPTGAENAAIEQVYNKRLRALEQLNYEITVEQARLAWQDWESARQHGVSLENVFRSYQSAYQQRLLEAAKYTADSSIALLDAIIKENQMAVEEYKAKALAFEAKVRASMLEIEYYGKQIEAEKSIVQLKGLEMEGLMKAIDGIGFQVKLYEAEIQGAIAQSQLNSAKVQMYAEKVRAFTAAIGADTALIDMWLKENEMNKVEADVYTAQVQGYTAKVQGILAKADIEKLKIETNKLQNADTIAKAQFWLSKYQTELQEEIAKKTFELQNEELKVKVHASKSQAKAQLATAAASVHAAKAQESAASLQVAVEQNKVNIAGKQAELSVAVEALKSIAQFNSQLASAVYSAINVGATISDNLSRNRSDSSVYNASVSNAYEHRYEESR